MVFLTIATKHGEKGKDILRPRQKYTKKERDSPECEVQERRQKTRNRADTNSKESCMPLWTRRIGVQEVKPEAMVTEG